MEVEWSRSLHSTSPVSKVVLVFTLFYDGVYLDIASLHP